MFLLPIDYRKRIFRRLTNIGNSAMSILFLDRAFDNKHFCHMPHVPLRPLMCLEVNNYFERDGTRIRTHVVLWKFRFFRAFVVFDMLKKSLLHLKVPGNDKMLRFSTSFSCTNYSTFILNFQF
jgi:hypothetical protein